jgi:hypothetical protein
VGLLFPAEAVQYVDPLGPFNLSLHIRIHLLFVKDGVAVVLEVALDSKALFIRIPHLVAPTGPHLLIINNNAAMETKYAPPLSQRLSQTSY